jgi:hypothetical protein
LGARTRSRTLSASGKSTYAELLARTRSAPILASSAELTEYAFGGAQLESSIGLAVQTMVPGYSYFLAGSK